MNKPNCCEKCRTSPRIIPEVKRELEKLGPYGCWLDNCTCHSPKTTDSEDWEEVLKKSEMYKRIVATEEFCLAHGWIPYLGMNIFDFIRMTRTAAYESGRNNAVDFIKRYGNWDMSDADISKLFEHARLLDT